jgi:uncharacterized OB-fold protein
MWEKVARSDAVLHRRGDIPIHHRYTMGVAGERFFRAMRDEKRLLASRCPGCRTAFLPPKMYCESCFEETTDWIPVEGAGYVKSFTVLHLSLDEEPLAEPVVAALIGWEGIRGGLIHRIDAASSGTVRTGTKVEPVWAGERAGTLEDISHFRPVP